MGHAHDGIYNKHYQNDVVDADIVSAVLEKPSDEASMRLLGHVALTRDPNAPTKLSPTQRRQVVTCEEVQAANAQYVASNKEFRRDFGPVTKARKCATDLSDRDKLKARLKERDQLYRKYKQTLEQVASEKLATLRADYFQRLGSMCLENQFTGKEEPTGPTPPQFAFFERDALVSLLFPHRHQPTTYEQQVEQAAQMIRLLGALCDRRDNRRSQQDDDELSSDVEPVDACFVDTCPDIFPVLCPGTQCLFCLGDESLFIPIRTRCFKNTYTLTRHVQAQHLSHIPRDSSFGCPHPFCQVTRTLCDNVNHFKVHALKVHNIIHGA